MMELLESVQVSHDSALDAFRLPVQYVNRPNLDFRGFCGTIAAGQIRVGDAVLALPSGKQSKVKSIVAPSGDVNEAFVGQAITLTLENEIDISRGDMIVRADEQQPTVSQAFDAHIVWMNESPLQTDKEYAFKLAGKAVFGRVEKILHRIDVNSLEHFDAPQLGLNEIGLCRINVTAPVVFDTYRECRSSGNLIVIDRLSNATAGAGMIVAAAHSEKTANDAGELARLRAFEIELNGLVRKYFPHWQAADISKLLG